MFKHLNRLALYCFIFSIAVAIWSQNYLEKNWVVQENRYAAIPLENGDFQLEDSDEKIEKAQILDQHDLLLKHQTTMINAEHINYQQQWITNKNGELTLLVPAFHFGLWSLLPAFLTISLCLITREPLTALLGGIVVGAVMLGKFDLTGSVLIPSLSTEGAISLLILYLWLLGGLLGLWTKTGAAQAFAHYMTEHFVRGPRSAKLVTWFLGIIFFQGGTMSTVLVGTTVRPLADKAKVSHEEMSYIVDSTASPIAAVIAFNAWPAYVQALIFVPGVSFLATESDRIAFFFSSIPFSFYGMLAVIGTLLLSLNITVFAGKRIRQARERALTTGQPRCTRR